jgi:putative endonuclease
MFWMYMLKCSDDSFYVGHTDNIELRIAQHEQGSIPSCYTYWRRPVTVVFVQDFVTREEALMMERRIKGWSRAKKIALVDRDWESISRLAKSRSQHPSTGSGRTE